MKIESLERRVDALEASADAASRPSKVDMLRRLDPVTLRLLVLGVCILTAAGVIRPEAVLKMLPLILKLAIGP
jgi:hypothetical protein